MNASSSRVIWLAGLIAALILAGCGVASPENAAGDIMTPGTSGVGNTGGINNAGGMGNSGGIANTGEEVGPAASSGFGIAPTGRQNGHTASPAPGTLPAALVLPQIGGSVSVLATLEGPDLENFMAMVRPFEQQTGISVQYEGTFDLDPLLTARIAAGNPPDVAALSTPRQLTALAQAGTLQPLDDVLDLEDLRASYNPNLLNQTVVDGNVYGIFTRVEIKSLVWYNPRQFEAKGYQVPGTWAQLVELEQQVIDSGSTPWCVGLAAGDGISGTGTDWIEDILMRTAGPDTYDRWSRRLIPWTDEAIVNAFQTWGAMVSDPRMVFGGLHSLINTSPSQALFPLFERPPQCYLHRQANAITRFIDTQRPDLLGSIDYSFFVFPPIDRAQPAPLLVSGELFGMFNDTPQARALVQYLASPAAHSQWAARGGFLSANQFTDPAIYPDGITQQLSELLYRTDQLHYDASELMPASVHSAFVEGILQFIDSPDQLQSILEGIEVIAASAAPP